ncbi:DUF3566 domain-containing protein [Mycobacterium sp. M1]|uniref:DUF3566 domain-containing protein n=1 Tax=Mycolicibacter acidiphilus TaxID=2835306 RepID=A0ABS5RHI4_9MYCO|nr:DUF3566 domain-containing protein [Mycolicibacter acidiphilus]MBS9533755.1 DUF3566 domain-containing protein [Mycolicibacter acidiphilus]
MTGPKDPGPPGQGAGKTAPRNGPADPSGRPAGRPGRITETGEPPPWQRGQGRAPAAPPAGRSPGVDERVRRFVSGTSAPGSPQPAPAPEPVNEPVQQPAKPVPPAKPAAPAPPEPVRAEVPAAADAYGSELPDLSGPPAARMPTLGRRPQAAAGPRGPLRASMQIRRIDPWSALKVSLLLSVALFFVWMIAVAILYLLLGAMGVWSKLNSNFGELMNTGDSASEMISTGSIFGGATLIGLVNIVVLTAMATIGAVIYNLSTDVVGGVEVTLADRD